MIYINNEVRYSAERSWAIMAIRQEATFATFAVTAARPNWGLGYMQDGKGNEGEADSLQTWDPSAESGLTRGQQGAGDHTMEQAPNPGHVVMNAFAIQC